MPFGGARVERRDGGVLGVGCDHIPPKIYSVEPVISSRKAVRYFLIN